MIRYQIHMPKGLGKTRSFDSPEMAARYWDEVNEPLSRLFIVEDGKIGYGTAAKVKPVYDALAKIRA